MGNYNFNGNLIDDKDVNFDRVRGLAIDKDGQVKKIEALLVFSCDELNKDYVVVTDWTYNDKDELNVGIYSYTENDGKMINFIPVTDKDELLMAEDAIDQSIEYIDEMIKSKEGV